jgi:hypothetical protein
VGLTHLKPPKIAFGGQNKTILIVKVLKLLDSIVWGQNQTKGRDEEEK